MRRLAPVRVRRNLVSEEWQMICRPCGSLSRSHQLPGWGWEEAMVQALGHLSLKHPQWPSLTNGC